jgi:hypothetical protein
LTSRSDFRIVAEALDWPTVEAPFTAIINIDPGEEAWESFITSSTPPAREAVLKAVAPWLVPEMLATEAARERLLRWAKGGGLLEPDTPEARRAIIARIPFVGDDMLQPLVEQALQQLPPPVLDHVRRHGLLLPVGLSCGGFAALEPTPEPDAVEVRRLLVLHYAAPAGRLALARLVRRWPRLERWFRAGTIKCSDDVFLALVAHEVAHNWLLAAPPPAERRPRAEAIEQHDRLIEYATKWGLLHRVIDPRAQDEHQAERLAYAWGFAQATRGDACARNARREVLAEAAAIAARPAEGAS